MPVTTRNILVGAGHLFVADEGAALPTWTVAEDAVVDFEADADWDSVGGTQEGVEVSYQADYGEVRVDQLKDAAVMFNQGLTVTMNTNLAEATLENLALAWGTDGPVVAGDTSTFYIGVPDDTPLVRSVAVVGRGTPAAGGDDRERIYQAHRVMSIEGSTHALRSTEPTVFPVSFRLLPDPTQVKGREYGRIIDRVPGV